MKIVRLLAIAFFSTLTPTAWSAAEPHLGQKYLNQRNIKPRSKDLEQDHCNFIMIKKNPKQIVTDKGLYTAVGNKRFIYQPFNSSGKPSAVSAENKLFKIAGPLHGRFMQQVKNSAN